MSGRNGGSAPDAQEQNLFVTFSGGGHRATAFAIGLALALADTGAFRRVKAIASVSGGSVTNAQLGLIEGLEDIDHETLANELGPLASLVANTGVLNFTLKRVLWIGGAIALIYAAFFTGTVVWGEAWGIFSTVLMALGFAFLILAAIVVYVYLLAPLIAGAYWKFFFSPSTEASTTTAFRYLTQADGNSYSLSEMHPNPTHVLCSTDLKAASYAYFSNAGVILENYGAAAADSARNLKIATAVSASAGFPPVFPPVKVSTSELRFNHPRRRLGTHLKLLDGGVHDNLGAEWLHGHIKGAIGESNPIEFLCLDASTPDDWKGRWGRLGAYLRVVGVLFRSNTRTRTALLERETLHVGVDGYVIRLQETPMELARRIRDLSPDVYERLLTAFPALPQSLGSWDEQHWRETRNDINETPTVLSRLGVDRTLELVYHGYCQGLLALAALDPELQPRVLSFDDTRRRLGFVPTDD